MKKVLTVIAALVAFAGLGFVGYKAYQTQVPSPQETLNKALDTFSTLETVHADMNISTTIKGSPQGDIQGKVTGTSDIRLKENTQKARMAVNVSGVAVEMEMIVISGKEVYIKIPLLNPDWLSMDLEKLQKDAGLPIDLQSNDYVSQSIGFIKSLDPNSIKDLGTEEINAVRTRRFEVTIDKEKYKEYLKSIGTKQELIDSFKDSTLVMELWIDPSNFYIVKAVTKVGNLTIANPQTKTTSSSDVTSVITYSKFNEPVEVTKPEGAQPIEEVLKLPSTTAR